MGLKYLFVIILLIGVIFWGIKWIEKFFKKKKSNKRREKKSIQKLVTLLKLTAID